VWGFLKDHPAFVWFSIQIIILALILLVYMYYIIKKLEKIDYFFWILRCIILWALYQSNIDDFEVMYFYTPFLLVYFDWFKLKLKGKEISYIILCFKFFLFIIIIFIGKEYLYFVLEAFLNYFESEFVKTFSPEFWDDKALAFLALQKAGHFSNYMINEKLFENWQIPHLNNQYTAFKNKPLNDQIIDYHILLSKFQQIFLNVIPRISPHVPLQLYDLPKIKFLFNATGSTLELANSFKFIGGTEFFSVDQSLATIPTPQTSKMLVHAINYKIEVFEHWYVRVAWSIIPAPLHIQIVFTDPIHLDIIVRNFIDHHPFIALEYVRLYKESMGEPVGPSNPYVWRYLSSLQLGNGNHLDIQRAKQEMIANSPILQRAMLTPVSRRRLIQ